MRFDPSSQITLVVTSCGRFDLLRRTLESFDQFNSAPIREVFITEDSGDDAVHDCVPTHWRAHTTCLVNRPQLGQMRSVDLAYSKVTTPWVFHCEDDWLFYRPGFIEDSQRLLEADPQALQVWLRSFHHDLQVHSPYVSRGPRQQLNHVGFYRLASSKADWQGFSFNPGLRRLADYVLHAPYAAHGGEKSLSRAYAAQGRYALLLESDAVLHTGFAEHVEVPLETRRKRQRQRRERWRTGAALVLGLAVGLSIGMVL